VEPRVAVIAYAVTETYPRPAMKATELAVVVGE